MDLVSLGDVSDCLALGTQQQTMGAGSGSEGGIRSHRLFEEITLVECQRLDISHRVHLIGSDRVSDDKRVTVDEI
jgi:hypothetical protein